MTGPAPMLGDILAAARGSALRFHAWLEASDPDIAAAVKQAAEASSSTVTSWVRGAVADFSRFASEEDWATLVSGLRDSADPGTDCLVAMVHWRLTASTCGDHAAHPGREGGASDERTLESQA
jgi:hypothetical protein